MKLTTRRRNATSGGVLLSHPDLLFLVDFSLAPPFAVRINNNSRPRGYLNALHFLENRVSNASHRRASETRADGRTRQGARRSAKSSPFAPLVHPSRVGK